MAERKASERAPAERLIDELWPAPPPPSDMTARVMAAMAAGEGAPRPLPIATLVQPAAPALPMLPLPATTGTVRAGATDLDDRRRPSRAALLAGGLAAAVVALIGGWWLRSGPAEEGQQLARSRTTVTIAQRAAAAMEPGADLVWSVRRRAVRVEQRRGSVFYRVDRGGPFRVVTPAGEVEVTGTCFRVTLGGGAATLSAMTTLVSVLEGSVKVGAGDQRLTIQAGEAARLRPGHPPERVPGDGALEPPSSAGESLHAEEQARQLEERLRVLEEQMAARRRAAEQQRRFSRPALLRLPAKLGLRVHGQVDEVSLSVPPVAGGGAEVEVALDRGFKQSLFRGPARTGFVTVRAPERGGLYWRRLGGPDLLGQVTFQPERRRSVLELRRPHNLVKEGAESTSIYFQGAPPALTLAFHATAGAGGHRLRMYRAGQSSPALLDKVVNGTTHALPPAAVGEGTYVWTVQPLDQRGTPLGPVRANKLALVYDNALDALAITSPRPAQAVSARRLEVAGVAPLGARLFVNGAAASLDDKGRFRLKVNGAPRALIFRMLDGSGTESYWVRHVRPRS